MDLGETCPLCWLIDVLQGLLVDVFQEPVTELCQQCGADLPGPGQWQLSSSMVRMSFLEGF